MRMVSLACLTGMALAASAALAQEQTPAKGERLPPPSTHVSQELRDVLVRTPPLDVAAAKARVFGSQKEWQATLSREESSPLATEMAKEMGVTISPQIIAGVRTFRLTPKKIAANHAGHLFVYIHGGAFVEGWGLSGTIEGIGLAAGVGINVLGIDYRLAPEHPAPAARDDIISVWRSIAGQHDPKSIGLGGSSAGGNLALVATLRMKELGLGLPGALFVGTPPVDLAKRTDSRFINEGIDRHMITWDGAAARCVAAYVGSGSYDDPYVSPVFGDFSGFPPAYLISGTRDLLLSDTVIAHRKLRKAGVVADLHVYEGQSHGDYAWLPKTPEAKEHFQELSAFLLRHLK